MSLMATWKKAGPLLPLLLLLASAPLMNAYLVLGELQVCASLLAVSNMAILRGRA